jgi:hypothetical protein
MRMSVLVTCFANSSTPYFTLTIALTLLGVALWLRSSARRELRKKA